MTEGKTMIELTNPHNHSYTLHKYVAEANFKVMTQYQAANAELVPHAQVLLINNHPEECKHILSQLLHQETETVAKRWHPTPETCEDPRKLSKIERRIYDEIITIRCKEQLNPRKTFLSKINRNQPLLNKDEKA